MSKNSEIYALVDCNNFYVSCERVFRPDLIGKPVGVLSNNDGIIVAASEELKRLGINRGDAAFKLKKEIAQHKITLFSSNYALYGDISARVMKTLSLFTPDIEVYSIDEAFLLLTGFEDRDLSQYAKLIKQTVQKWTGIPISIGIGETKTLAKVANHIAKKNSQYRGVFDITKTRNKAPYLERVPTDKIWGVGHRYARMLDRNGITNALQLSCAPYPWVRKNMTVVGLRTVMELNGISCIDLERDVPPKKEIVSSRSFGRPVTELQELKQAVSEYCTRAVEKLRQDKQLASQIMVYLTTNRFKNEPQYANFDYVQLTVPSAYTPSFIQAAQRILKNLYREGYRYKKVGVMLSNFVHESQVPGDLFDPSYLDDRRKEIMECIDQINRKWGSNTISYASSGVNKEWQMRRKLLSPRYTTNWREIPKVKA